ncbi:ABC transporter ATP-binding protein [Jannaschia sp. R86511]|uniref:ABC transporter ATP-binding protein n=1 Tax=Jannaschia sp. R86511 TaxID=3093853 RepID=UPI0036D4006F
MVSTERAGASAARPGGAGPDDAVRCEAVTRFYRSAAGETHALRGVDARFAAGTVSCVVGPSGSGKSSLLQVLALREVPDGGQVWLAGQATVPGSTGARRRWRRRLVAWVPQRATHALLPHLSAAEHVVQVANLRGVDADVRAVLDEVGLRRRRRSHPAQLSGGEQQRLAVALAAVGDPPVLVADEPTAELDDEAAALVLDLLRRSAAAGACVVVSTHDARVTTRSDRVLLLRHGVLSTDARAGDGAEAVLDSTGRLQLPPEALALFPDGRARLEVRDDEVVLRPPGDRP